MYNETDRYKTFCDRVCTYIMSYELGIPSQWDAPLPPEGNGRRGESVSENLRLAVIDRHIHYYQRSSTGEEYEIQPKGPLWWLPSVPEHLCSSATDEQLKATETLLGFPLPSPLRELYQQVANGGFGPGQDGLFGVLGCEQEEIWLLTDQYKFQKNNYQSIDLSMCEYRLITEDEGYTKYLANWEIFVPKGYWPECLLPICHDGDGLFYYLDVPTGRVFYAGEDYLAFRLMANSLEDLFERWMSDDLFDYQRFREESHQQFGENFVDPFPDRGV